MDWLFKFPQLNPELLLALKRAIDGSLRSLTRVYGQSIEDFFNPLLRVLIFFENVISSAPWPLVVLALTAVAWFAARRWTVVVAVAVPTTVTPRQIGRDCSGRVSSRGMTRAPARTTASALFRVSR